jgi:hypothetical protein
MAVFLILLAGAALSQTETVKKTPLKKNALPKDVPEIPLMESRITFGYDTFDFGDVPPAVSVTHDFPVANTGKDTLIISAVKAG